MTWTTPGSSRLPTNWRTIRTHVLRRDGHRCTWTGPQGETCSWHDPSGRTLEVDHVGDRNDHRIHMLRTLCGHGSRANHHAQRTARQSAAARPSRTRPTQPHPGLTA